MTIFCEDFVREAEKLIEPLVRIVDAVVVCNLTANWHARPTHGAWIRIPSVDQAGKGNRYEGMICTVRPYSDMMARINLKLTTGTTCIIRKVNVGIGNPYYDQLTTRRSINVWRGQEGLNAGNRKTRVQMKRLMLGSHLYKVEQGNSVRYIFGNKIIRDQLFKNLAGRSAHKLRTSMQFSEMTVIFVEFWLLGQKGLSEAERTTRRRVLNIYTWNWDIGRAFNRYDLECMMKSDSRTVYIFHINFVDRDGTAIVFWPFRDNAVSRS